LLSLNCLGTKVKNSHAQGHNGAVLEALFIVSYVLHGWSRFNRENPAITATIPTMPMISCLHDARRCWKQRHKTFSGIIKARERPRWEAGGELDWKGDEKRKGAGENRGTNKTQTWEELEEEHWKHKKKGGLYREGEKGRGATQRRVLALPLPSSLQKKKDP